MYQVGKSRALPKLRKLDDRRVESQNRLHLSENCWRLAILPEHALRQSVTSKNRDGSLQFPTWGTDTDPAKIMEQWSSLGATVSGNVSDPLPMLKGNSPVLVVLAN